MLFVGDDATSPQIAAALLRQLIGDDVALIRTAGTRPYDPGGRTDELLVAMGLDPTDELPLRPATLYGADRVVVLGTAIDVARLPGPHYEEWDLEHDDLDDRVLTLAHSLRAQSLPARALSLSRRALSLAKGRAVRLLDAARSVRLFLSIRRWRRRSAARAAQEEIETGS